MPQPPLAMPQTARDEKSRLRFAQRRGSGALRSRETDSLGRFRPDSLETARRRHKPLAESPKPTATPDALP